ncbi:S-adenosyl-L-methionine-dependent methyltransferase [Rhexocercosporidium sp. MPI-PUGE-AT-0058]|nr:S-adenosyl-L-methionine-dependent methyltransferase [Rhexocercosporidium sp. MPI-PUGE-AT-0058]
MAHLRWFSHGAATAIGELASAHELFLLTECDDEEVSCIAGKISAVFLDSTTTFSDNIEIAEKRFEKSGKYYYSLHYNPDTKQYTDATDHETTSGHSGAEKCECCDRQAAKVQTDDIKILGPVRRNGAKLEFEGFKSEGNSYFLHDFVYVYVPGETYHIGQIINISVSTEYYDRKKETVKRSRLRVRLGMFARFDDFQRTWLDELQEGRTHAIRDERRLYYTVKKSVVRPDQLDGKCYVRHPNDIEDINKYKDKPDRFWVENQAPEHPAEGVIREADLLFLSAEDLSYSKQSKVELLSEERQIRESLDIPKLKGMEVFAGAGGLTAGLELSGAVESVYAVEFSEAACRTYENNFPNAQVCCADASILLEHAIKREKGKEVAPILDCHGNPLPNLPRRGEIDFICGGCPCPGYSGLNRSKKSEDIKNSLLMVLLSYVDFYRPKYFLLENVRGLLHHRVTTQVDKNKTEGGIENGTVKFVLRALTSIGYQVHYALLQAIEHGAPSSRSRVFFWASLPGYPLPKFPQPQHFYKSTIVCQEMTWYRTRRSAPHRAYTVGDSMTDLPGFDWRRPRLGKDGLAMSNNQQGRKHLKKYKVIQGEDSVGLNEQSYASQPLCEYQRKLRAKVGKNPLMNHVTQHWSEERTALVCDVPLWPGADHRDVPDDANKPSFLYHEELQAAKNKFYPGRYGRLDMEGTFDVCLTSMNPGGQNGRVLHPTQRRVVSVREYARAMGFPDWFIFDLDGSRVLDIIRQIGNAVPPYLAKSLGEGLRESRHIQRTGEDENRRHLRTVPKRIVTQGCSTYNAICLDSDEEG